MRPLHSISFATLAVLIAACGEDASGSPMTATATEASSSGAQDDGNDDGNDDAQGTTSSGANEDSSDSGVTVASADTTASTDPTTDPTAGTETGDDTGPEPFGPSPGCGMQPGSIVSGTINADGIDREYILQLPDDYDPDYPYPLIFGFHGLGENMDTARWRFQAGEQWGGQAIGIYPQGRYFANLGATNWEYGEDDSDVKLWDALATAASEQLCIDRDRIFVQGFSSGGFFVHALMCYRGDYIRAAAPSGGGMVVTDCGGAVPMWSAHATNDDTVPYHYGTDMRDFWLDKAGCSNMTSPIDPSDKCVEYQGCGDNPVVWCDFDQGHWYMEDWKTPATTAFFMRFEPLVE
ncbi:MAG: hypothetical protein K1X88_23185 [Nannocystaceae bacterium]|nr:hypothetical protein [Nannocystaceae bacterium]